MDALPEYAVSAPQYQLVWKTAEVRILTVTNKGEFIWDKDADRLISEHKDPATKAILLKLRRCK